MVSKCANPECETPFRSMRTGRLIRVEGRPARQAQETEPEFNQTIARRTEFFWLCDGCSSRGLVLQKDGTIALPVVFVNAVSSSL